MIKYNFNERTSMLPLLDAYLAISFAEKFRTALEVGVYKGWWIFTLLDNNPNIFIVGIDPYPNLEVIRKTLIDDISTHKFSDRVQLHSSFHDLSIGDYKNLTYGMIHIDGEHSESQVLRDLGNALPLLEKDGILIVDDIFYHSYPGVTAATFSFIRDKKLSPFLFTEKKMYFCNPDYYKIYYKSTLSFLKLSKTSYEETLNAQIGTSYKQSNAIFGHELIITPSNPTRIETKNLNKTLGVKLPLVSRFKNAIRFLTPPGLLEMFKILKAKVWQ
jgi:hypothetical protein